MSKKIEDSVEDLRAQLIAEKAKSDQLQKDNENRQRSENERIKREEDERERQRLSAASSEPTEEQWVKLEEEYGMTRDGIRSSWKIAQKVAAPLTAELQGYRVKEAAQEAVRVAKSAALASDPQFPKYEGFVDEYLADVPAYEKSDKNLMAKHMDRALNFAQGKARRAPGFREQPSDSPKDGLTQEQKDDAAAGFGSHEISGIPLTINIEKRVPDDFRKLHAHPDKEGGVRMNERSKWNESIPKKPR
jgi:hypothetical protein